MFHKPGNIGKRDENGLYSQSVQYVHHYERYTNTDEVSTQQ